MAPTEVCKQLKKVALDDLKDMNPNKHVTSFDIGSTVYISLPEEDDAFLVLNGKRGIHGGFCEH